MQYYQMLGGALISLLTTEPDSAPLSVALLSLTTSLLKLLSSSSSFLASSFFKITIIPTRMSARQVNAMNATAMITTRLDLALGSVASLMVFPLSDPETVSDVISSVIVMGVSFVTISFVVSSLVELLLQTVS